MDSQGSLLTLSDTDKFSNYVHGRHAAIRKVQLVVFDPIFNKIIGLVSLIIQSDYSSHSQLFEDRYVVSWRKGPILHL